ncbi:MAG: S8 family serine peptidase [Anaerolineaceae bacterium]|nr:S8 family serine peptidase [Anaerolineaceae bacterium]
MSPEKRSTKMSDVKVPERLFATASPLSVGGVSLFDAGARINANTVANFYSEEKIIYNAVSKLRLAGFEILQISQTTINIAGSLDTYMKAFNTKIVHEERPVIKPGAVEDTATFWECPASELPGLIPAKGTPFEDVLEGVAIEEPRYFMESMLAPTKAYWHLTMPGDVSLGCNADRAHRAGITGKGIKVAMVDSGWYKHPYFVGRGYRVSPVVLGPGAANPLRDESGHGTGESANIFAVAPDVQLLPVKINFVNSLGAFNAAIGLGPDIITCSWGSSNQNGPLSAADQALAAAIATAVASGIIVIFSAGNGHWGFPGQHPDVISAGGVFMDQDGSLRASNYASGFMSNIYPNRRVPDLSGLVGMSPGASYIMLPLEPGDQIDTDRAGGVHPPQDETAPNDGWAVFSGTSAAAPQLAGAAALVKEACSRLTPADVRDVLMKSAHDVTVGNCSPSTGGNAAVVGPDTATGNGLVDAHKAVLLAKIRCMGPIRGIRRPIEPIEPIRRPIEPIEPIRRPIEPIEPIRRPIEPIEPIRTPIEPVQPRTEERERMLKEASVEQPASKLSQEDIEALEDLILSTKLDPEDLK